MTEVFDPLRLRVLSVVLINHSFRLYRLLPKNHCPESKECLPGCADVEAVKGNNRPRFDGGREEIVVLIWPVPGFRIWYRAPAGVNAWPVAYTKSAL